MLWSNFDTSESTKTIKMLIPKIIHQTIRSKAALHTLFQENIECLKSINPGWEHRLYDDEDCRQFILQAYGQDYLDTFNRIDSAYGAAKADFFRYLLMYEYGGVYLDIKSRTRLPLTQVLADDDHYILS
jgi:mannosyltransferase OCH1-like enzyme